MDRRQFFLTIPPAAMSSARTRADAKPVELTFDGGAPGEGAPCYALNGCADADPETTYLAAAKLLGTLGIAYIHIAEADWDDAPHMPVEFKQKLRAAFPGTLIYAGKYTSERARAALREGWADLIAFGRPFVANPDLPERLRTGATLNAHDRATLFGGDAHGFTDYPVLAVA